MDKLEPRRRTVLAVAGGSLTAGFAGCLGDDDETGGENGGEEPDSEDNQTGGESGGEESGSEEDQTGGENEETDESEDSEALELDPSGAIAVVKESYELSNQVESQADADGFITDIEGILHSSSPLPDFFRTILEEDGGVDDVTTENLETEVVARNVGKTEIEEQFQFFAAELSDGALDGIAGQNVIVEAEFEESGADADEGVQTERWLVAIEDGEWALVF